MNVKFENKVYQCEPGETVLETLLRHEASVPFSCKAGVCQSCIMKVVEGHVPSAANEMLSEAQREAGLFLPCSCIPDESLVVGTPDDLSQEKKIPAKVISKEMLSPTIVRLRIRPGESFSYRPGQFINLFKNATTVRSYSLASVPKLDDFIELHIQLLPNGEVSSWLHNELTEGETVHISRAMGECYYRDQDPNAPLLLIGTGSGLAPLYGILRDALAKQHKGDIYLYHGSSNSDGLYLRETLHDLAREHTNFHYFPSLSSETVPGIEHGRASDIALSSQTELKNWKVYLCGHPDMVNGAKKKAFLAGASLADIYSDAFTHA